MKTFFFWSSLLFGRKMNICGHAYLFFFGHHFFSGRNIFSNSKWGCENWLVMQKGCQQVKRLKTTAVGAALSLALAVSYVDKQLSASLSVQEVWGSNPGSVNRLKIANGSLLLRHFFEVCYPSTMPRRWALPRVTRFGVIPRV